MKRYRWIIMKSGFLGRFLHRPFEALVREAQLATRAAVTWLGKPTRGVFYLDSAFGTAHFNDLVFHYTPPLVHAGSGGIVISS